MSDSQFEDVCVVIPTVDAMATTDAATNEATTSNDEQQQQQQQQQAAAPEELKQKGTCCFLMKFGACNPRNPPCRFYHPPDGEIVDDGVSPCAFGLACRQGHAKRMKVRFSNKQEKKAFWDQYFGYDSGESPAVRDATLLQSQLEPWPTSNLRQRLVKDFSESYKDMDLLDRKSLMDLLLKHYEQSSDSNINTHNLPMRKHIKVQGGTPLPESLCEQLLEELRVWRKKQGKVNTRPSIRATSYLVLRAPTEEERKQKEQGTLSRRARVALYKTTKHQSLWDLALKTLELIKPHDPEFLHRFSAMAVTYNFVGSPHIDKQNTGPFYGLSLGEFRNGGDVCVEADAFTVAHIQTHNCLSKCDGRYPHWVSNYEGDRYSLIFYATSTDKHEYIPPARAYFGQVVEGE